MSDTDLPFAVTSLLSLRRRRTDRVCELAAEIHKLDGQIDELRATLSDEQAAELDAETEASAERLARVLLGLEVVAQ